MRKTNWQPLGFIFASQALKKMFDRLEVVRFCYVAFSGTATITTVPMASEVLQLRIKASLVHQAMFKLGLDVNNLRTTHPLSAGKLISSQALYGTMLRGAHYANELRGADPRIIPPISRLKTPSRMVPLEAVGAPYVPVTQVTTWHGPALTPRAVRGLQSVWPMQWSSWVRRTSKAPKALCGSAFRGLLFCRPAATSPHLVGVSHSTISSSRCRRSGPPRPLQPEAEPGNAAWRT